MLTKLITSSGIYFRRIKKGTLLNLLIQIFGTFGLGFASYYLKVQGVELYKIVLIGAISPLTSLPVLLLSNHWSIKRYIRLGILAYTGMALSLVFFNPYSYLLVGIFYGLALGMLWVSLNYVFFRESDNNHHGKDSSIYFILGPMIGIILPPVEAAMINGWGFTIFFTISAALSLIPLLYVRGSEFDHTVRQSFREADKAFAGLRLFTFYDAALHFFHGHFLGIYVLLFLKTEYELGGLMSLLAILSLLASFLLSDATDKFKNRVQMLYPLLIMMGVLMLVMPTLQDIGSLVFAIGLYTILDNLSMPIRFAIPMDMVERDIGFWRINEFWGNLGRTIVFVAAALLVLAGNYWLAFVLFAVITFAFPFIASRKIKWMRTHRSQS